MSPIGLAVISAAMLAASSGTLAHETGDCFPVCAPPSAGADAAVPLNLCEHAIVREGLRFEQETRPIREMVNAVQDPTGFVIRQVSAHVFPIPRWVGYVVDPKGAVRAKLIQTVRDEMKQSLGLANDCREAETSEAADYSAIT